MKPQRAEELLYDSEATLRLLDAEVARVRKDDAAPGPADPALQPVEGLVQNLHSFDKKPAIMLLPHVLTKATDEIRAMLASLRDSRAALEHATVDRLATTQNKLREVSSATEVAATDMLDGLDRAQQLIDQLDGLDDAPVERRKDIRNQLRDEIFTVMSHLQFQDITTQQLNHASRILIEMEERLNEVARIIDPDSSGFHTASVREEAIPDEKTFDPNATVKDAETRQALADEVFRKTGT
jgi:chemotaxis regulatin CheY-phosphate phosphatase CheZ